MKTFILIASLHMALPVAAQYLDDDRVAGVTRSTYSNHVDMPVMSEMDEKSSSYLRALDLIDRDLDEAALIHLDRMLVLSPYDVGGLLHRGEALVRLGEYDAAKADLLEVIELMPNGSAAERALSRLGMVSYLKGDLVAAHAYFDRVVAMDPDNAHALCERGIARAALFMNEEALTDLRSAIVLNPELPQAHAHLAIVLIRSQHKEEACDALAMARSLGDHSVEELMVVHCID